MATLNNILADVQEITTRPDFAVLALTKSSIRDAILACHGSSEYSRDIRTHAAPAFAADSSQKVSIALPNRYRKLVKKAEVVALYADGTSRNKFKRVEAGQILRNAFGFSESDYFSEIGGSIQVCYSGAPSGITLSYYEYPEINIPAMNTTSWIAEVYPAAIVYRAAARVFTAIGKAEDAQTYTRMYNEELRTLWDNHSHED